MRNIQLGAIAQKPLILIREYLEHSQLTPPKKQLSKRRKHRYNSNPFTEPKSIGAGINKMTQKSRFNFFKDFSVGCGTMILLGFLIFVLVPLIFIGFQIALWLAVPVVGLIVIIVLVALFGRFISEAGKRW